VLDYGVSFFYQALAIHFSIKQERMEEIAIAVRAANLDEKSFKKFIKNG